MSMSKRADGRIAPTLLNNWVEERAAHELLQQQQRQKAEREHQAQFEVSGKRLDAEAVAALTPLQQKELKRQALERQLWEQAVRETMVHEEVPSARDWMSLYQETYDQHGLSFEEWRPTPEQIAKYALPISFHSQQAGKPADERHVGGVYCSSPTAASGQFGRHTDFSKPIDERLHA